MKHDREKLIDKIIDHWERAMSLEDLLAFYREKTYDWLQQEGDEEIMVYAEDAKLVDAGDTCG